ncbi:MAG: glycosyltransferase family 39 protein [Candidatus Korobacteraceae bacterium]
MKPSASQYWTYGLLLLVILFFALIRFHLRQCPLERDEGEYAYAGQLLLQGIPPYQLVYSMKLPGTFAAYSVVLALFGQTPGGIHLGLLLVNAATTFLVFLLTRRLFGQLAGLVAGASYALLSTSPSVLGFAGHATHFVVLPALGGILLLLVAMETRRVWLFFASGVLLGLAFLMKQPGILFAAFGGLYLVKSEYRDGRLDWRALAPKAGAFALGTLLPFAVTCLALFAAGSFEKFWFWTFQYSREYASLLGIRGAIHNFPWNAALVVKPALGIWAIAAVGFTALGWNHKARAHGWFLAGFLLFSFLAVCPGFYFRTHYFILMLPAIALLAGVAVSAARQGLLEGRRRAWSFVPVLVFLIAFADSIFLQREYFFATDPLTACQTVYYANPFPEALQVGEYLKRHSGPGARIAVIGSEPEIYFYAHRHSATGYIYTYGLMEPQRFALEMQKEMIAEIEAVRPEFVVFVNVPLSFGRLTGSEALIFSWTDSYVHSQYEKIGVVDMNQPTEYIWGSAAQAYQPRSRSFIDVFRRKQSAD